MNKYSNRDLPNDNTIPGAQNSGIRLFISLQVEPSVSVKVLERERNIECVMEEGGDYQFCHRPTVALSLFPQGSWPQNPEESVPGWSKFVVKNRCIQADAADAHPRFPFLAPLLSPICLHCWLLTVHSCPLLWGFALNCGCCFTQEVIHIPPSRGSHS